MTPGSVVTCKFLSSISKMLLNLSIAITKPPKWGRAPPVSPVPAPLGVTGIKCWLQSINNFEKHLALNGVIILKFFLHLSKEEQRQRLLRRLEKEKHNWKFSPADLKERPLWEDYQKCYEEAINKTSKPHAPWIVIPADNKETARYLVAKSILEELEKYEFHYPELDDEVKDNIKMYHEKLASEK